MDENSRAPSTAADGEQAGMAEDGVSFQVRAFDQKVWILVHLFVARSFAS